MPETTIEERILELLRSWTHATGFTKLWIQLNINEDYPRISKAKLHKILDSMVERDLIWHYTGSGAYIDNREKLMGETIEGKQQ